MARRTTWVLIVLCGVTLGVYVQVGGHDFVNLDDFDYVSENPQVNRGLSWQGVRWAFTAQHSANWHPLTTLSHMLDVQLFGLDPGPMHLVNVLFHLLNTVLLFRLLHGATGSTWRTAVVAGLFALHPLHVESVAWISERKDVLSTFFWLATMLAYSAWTRRPSAARYSGVVALFALGLLSKAMLVTLPLVLVLWDVWPLSRVRPARLAADLRRSVREKLPLLALSAAHSVVTLFVQASAGATMPSGTIPLASRLGNAAVTYGRYLWDLLWPVGLSPSYPHTGAPPAWTVGVALAGIAIVGWVAWKQRDRWSWWTVGWCWYLGTLVPVIGIVQVGIQSRADRYTYLPMIGVTIVLAWGLEAWTRNRSLVRTICIELLAVWGLALIVVTTLQVARWKDGPTLFRYALSITPDNYQIHEALGVELARAGDVPAAMKHFRRVVDGLPNRAASYYHLGLAYIQSGNPSAGLIELERALELDPEYTGALDNAAYAHGLLGRYDVAAATYGRLIELRPNSALAWRNLGVAEIRCGRLVEGRAATQRALELARAGGEEELAAQIEAQLGEIEALTTKP
ncbi:MAG: tetratricopeptide repeat protein [Acidobacteriota bacterium]